VNLNAPMCLACTRYDPETGGCAAYPGGVPDEIIRGEWDHRVGKPGDHGLLYDAKPGAPAQMPWWPHERRGRVRLAEGSARPLPHQDEKTKRRTETGDP